ncbi:MAG: tRNA lysidine(34) synthetase TilS [Ruminococcus sp.]|nr:tRNA lysidine(34) synthetase TilS [Ruminococcus sp.]
MTCKIIETIEKYNMLKNVRSVAVGVSGGADSVCLLHFLSKIMGKYDIVLCAVHVNHNIRGDEAKRDENFVKDFCDSLGVECRVFNVDVPALAKEKSLSEEECGRAVRYDCFNKMNTDAIAVAHTLSDSVETVLFNLTRGTGLKGICGIPPVRDNIIRPLIEMTRDDVERYCAENELSYVTDSTNLEDDYTRNKIRHGVIPILKQINPNFEETVLRFENSVSEDNALLDSMAHELLHTCETKDGYSLSLFIKANKAVQKRAVSVMIADKLNKPVEARHIDMCFDIINSEKGKIELSKDLYISVYNDIITFHMRDKQVDDSWFIEQSDGVFESPFGQYAFRLCKVSELTAADYDNAVDEAFLTGKLVMRSRKPGDRFSDIKRKNTKTLKKIFNQIKIPPEIRNRIAVLCSDDKILWVEGLGTDAKYRINKNSKYAYIIQKRGSSNE